MRIEASRHGAVTVLRPEGPLIGEDADQLRTMMRESFHESMGRLVVDLGEVAYVDSAGLDTLVDAGETIADIGMTLKVAGANETLREVFDLTGVRSRFEQFEDVPAAVRSFL